MCSRHHRENLSSGHYLGGESTQGQDNIGECFGSHCGRKNVINHVTSENLSANHQVMLTPIKHEDIETNVLNDAYLFGSQLGMTPGETAVLTQPSQRMNSSKRESRPAHSSNSEKVSHTNSVSNTKQSTNQHQQVADKYKDHSPRHGDISRASLEVEKTMLAAQGKLAYVSPTVRQSNNLNRHTFHGSTSQSQKHQPSAGNLGFVTRQAGGSLSQLSPAQPGLQLGQPAVLLNTGSQVDLHRYVKFLVFCDRGID